MYHLLKQLLALLLLFLRRTLPRREKKSCDPEFPRDAREKHLGLLGEPEFPDTVTDPQTREDPQSGSSKHKRL